MTDYISAFTIILERDISDEDANKTIAALKQIKGVLEVTPFTGDPISEMVGRSRLKSEAIGKLLVAIKEISEATC